MKPANLNLVIYQGTTFSKGTSWKNVDGTAYNLVGRTFRGQIRSGYDGLDILGAFEFDTSDLVHGNLTLLLGDSATSALPSTLNKSPLVYDIEMVNGSNVDRVFQGTVTVSPEVTK
jgi:hypothetical protein